MIQLTYVSRAAIEITAIELLSILAASRSYNRDADITGMLVFGNGTFLQTLEGDRETVERLFEKIARDPRHADVNVLRRREIGARRYSEWSMAFVRLSDHRLKDVDGVMDFAAEDFSIGEIARDPDLADRLLDGFRGPQWDPLVRELEGKDRLIAHLKDGLIRTGHRLDMAELVLEAIADAAQADKLDSAPVALLCELSLGALREQV